MRLLFGESRLDVKGLLGERHACSLNFCSRTHQRFAQLYVACIEPVMFLNHRIALVSCDLCVGKHMHLHREARTVARLVPPLGHLDVRQSGTAARAARGAWLRSSWGRPQPVALHQQAQSGEAMAAQSGWNRGVACTLSVHSTSLIRSPAAWPR